MSRLRPRLARAAAGLAAALGLAAAPATAAAAQKVCVYDPSGAAGPAFQHARTFQAAAAGMGVQLELKPYTDEGVAAADFRNKQCDAALLTGVRMQQFNKATFSLEAVGLIPTYDVLKTAIQTLSKEKAASLMATAEYEVAGVYPGGAVYLYLRDKAVSDVDQLAGKRICTMSFDKAANTMVKTIGASAVSADIGTFASKFNNGSCDVAYAPAAAYTPLELYKGMGEKGGLVRYPIAMMTLQLVIRPGSFPAGFGQQARTWSAAQFDALMPTLKKAEAEVRQGYWVEVDAVRKARYDDMLGKSRAELVAAGAYDPTVVKLVEQLRAR